MFGSQAVVKCWVPLAACLPVPFCKSALADKLPVAPIFILRECRASHVAQDDLFSRRSVKVNSLRLLPAHSTMNATTKADSNHIAFGCADGVPTMRSRCQTE